MLDLKKLSFQEQKELAQDENTPGEILTQLAFKRVELSPLVAKNPNTPVETLERLSNEFYEEVIDNPVFELLLLENCDRHWLKLCLAKSIKTSAETLDKLSCDCNFEIQKEVAKNPNISAKIIDKYAANKVGGWCMEHLIKHVDKISPATWLLLANQQNINRRKEFARCAQAPIEVMMALANDTDWIVRRYLADNPHLPLKILIKLARDIKSMVRLGAIENTRIPKEILIELAQDDDSAVRCGVAENSNTPANTLIELAQDEALSVRYCVAINSHTPVYIVKKLQHDANRRVRVAASKNLNNLFGN